MNMTMKEKTLRLILIGAICLATTVAFAGCGTSENSDQVYEGEEYDAEYLMTDYSAQLVTDGAEVITGSVDLVPAEGDGNYTVKVYEKKVVKNDNYDEGYYVADRNMTSEYPFNGDMGIVVYDDMAPIVCEPKAFAEEYSGDQDALYSVFVLGDGVELILPLSPEEQ